jgi:uncharacterized glyoxalase superfamily protein PhnB
MAKAKSSAKKKTPAKKPVKKSPAAKKRAPAKKIQGVPPGMHTITPSLVYKDASAAIAWYELAFGAKELRRMLGPDGKAVWHAEVKIGDSILFLNDEFPMSATVAPSGPRTGTASLQLTVPDVDALAKRAIEAGATAIMPVADMFWGDRMGVFSDPFGHVWSISTRVKVMTDDEMRAAGEAFAKSMAQGGPPPGAEAS